MVRQKAASYGSGVHTSEGGSDATIYDVARVAGVSPSTVSRAFARPGRVSAHTAELIHKVAEELGYRSRTAAKAPERATPPVLGLAVADITNPFNFRVIRGCQAAAAENGFVVALNDSQESEELERDLLRRSLPLLDGLIFASSRLPDAELRRVASGLPTIVLNRRVQGVPSIVPDMAEGIRQATQHLVSLGHTAISYLAGREASWADSMHWRAMTDAARAFGFALDRIGPFSPTLHGGRAAAEVIAARPVRAVICHNDLMAIGLLRALTEKGVRVPGRVSVVGFDNIFASALVEPGLTTVAAPLTMLGDAAVRHITAALAGGEPVEVGPLAMPMRLVVRGSTAAPA